MISGGIYDESYVSIKEQEFKRTKKSIMQSNKSYLKKVIRTDEDKKYAEYCNKNPFIMMSLKTLRVRELYQRSKENRVLGIDPEDITIDLIN